MEEISFEFTNDQNTTAATSSDAFAPITPERLKRLLRRLRIAALCSITKQVRFSKEVLY